MDSLTTRVIDWINEFNNKHDCGGIFPITTMPYGIPKDCDSCPVAQATGWEVHPTDIRNHITGDFYVLPDFVQEWIHAFDEGDYPEYDELQCYVDEYM